MSKLETRLLRCFQGWTHDAIRDGLLVAAVIILGVIAALMGVNELLASQANVIVGEP